LNYKQVQEFELFKHCSCFPFSAVSGGGVPFPDGSLYTEAISAGLRVSHLQLT